MSAMKKISIESMAGGAAVEAVNHCINEVLQNIMDPNTTAKQKRQVVLTLSFIPNEHRNMMDISFTASSKLAAAAPVETAAIIDKDHETGEMVGLELFDGQNPGQHTLPVEGVGEFDTSTTASKVVNLKK
jgi:hypothetical protein